MSLETMLQDQVHSAVQLQGRQFFVADLVSIKTIHDDGLIAVVKDRRPYRVSFVRSPGAIQAGCTCVQYNDGFVCKHIWAAILATDDARLFQPVPRDNEEMALLDDFGEILDPGTEDLKPDELTGWDDLSPFKHLVQNLVRRSHPPKPSWKNLIQSLSELPRFESTRHPHPNWPDGRVIQYRIDVESTKRSGLFTIATITRTLRKDGNWGKVKSLHLNPDEVSRLPAAIDRRIMAMLKGATSVYSHGSAYYYSEGGLQLTPELRDVVLPMLAESGRCRLYWPSTNREVPLKLDLGLPWVFRMEVPRNPEDSSYTIRGYLQRGDERRELDSPVLLVAGGWVFWEHESARLDDSGSFSWIALLRIEKSIRVPGNESAQLPNLLFETPSLPPLELPEELRYTEITLPPRPRLNVKPAAAMRGYSGQPTLLGALRFEYGDVTVPHLPERTLYADSQGKRLIRRDPVAERQARDTLVSLELRPWRYHDSDGPPPWEIPIRRLPVIVPELIARGWSVEAEGRLYRRPGKFDFDVSSGIDWFELRGKMDFDGASASLPALLQALKKKENTVILDDGSIGMLPEDWLRKYGSIAALGDIEGDHVRFQSRQAGLLDALLAAQPEATFDEGFRRIREQLSGFRNIQPAEAPPTFVGNLRDYQKDGLGWIEFLRRFSFGGCLADDMGLGKTIQVLALLEACRIQREAGSSDDGEPMGPSLAVVPRSLVFNWLQEAARFTPKLRILDHAHTTRERTRPDFSAHDLVIVTYGVLLRDISVLKDVRFEYVILDEAQAIKNAEAQVTKAARLLQGRHRLALSGTPIQNHLGELWSLFEFLNPGMLGSASVFQLTAGAGRDPSPETRELLARALRPFILRRTKGQVARELPERTEETIICELDRRQRQYYNELREHYRKSLLEKVDAVGINRSKIMVLEALLRLRQAACHPGLINPRLADHPCAKLDSLIPQLAEVMDEGHKVIVFSQFTSFLAILRKHLDGKEVVYEYLDGRTRDRGAAVERFQKDPACRLFLISLKAGGLGLNLTEAEYVFLLDPWWNPAIEAQAIDRAHRIGQTRNVFAYRLIARDTVEEKVLELQKTKRQLADSIISADNSIIRSLTRDDLALLLG